MRRAGNPHERLLQVLGTHHIQHTQHGTCPHRLHHCIPSGALSGYRRRRLEWAAQQPATSTSVIRITQAASFEQQGQMVSCSR